MDKLLCRFVETLKFKQILILGLEFMLFALVSKDLSYALNQGFSIEDNVIKSFDKSIAIEIDFRKYILKNFQSHFFSLALLEERAEKLIKKGEMISRAFFKYVYLLLTK